MTGFNPTLGQQEKLILKAVEQGHDTSQKLQDHLGMTQRGASAALTRLRKKGWITYWDGTWALNRWAR